MVDLVEERLNGTPVAERKALTKYGPGTMRRPLPGFRFTAGRNRWSAA